MKHCVLKSPAPSARAGNYGKGFGVIAGEVRKLADSTAENASQTNQTLKIVVKNIDQARSSSHKSVESYSEIQQQIQRLSQGLDSVMEQMTSLNEKSTQIMAMIQ